MKKNNSKKREREEVLSLFFGADLGGDVLELDLHGFDVYSGLRELDEFLNGAWVSGEDVVRVIHGSGGGVLRKAVYGFLGDCVLVEDYKMAGYPFSSGVVNVIIVRT